MWDKVITQMVLTIASMVATGVASYFIAMYKAKYEEEKKRQEERDELSKKLTKAVQLIMRRDLRNDAKAYLSENSLTAEEIMEFEEYYDCYEKLGKNGRVDNLVQRVRSLPIRENNNAKIT